MTAAVSALPKGFLAKIQSEFPKDFWTTAPEDLQIYETDWTKVYTPNASAVAFPRSTDEVSRFLKLCKEHKVAVVPSGGRTGLSGGAVAAQGEIVLSLVKMNRMEAVNPLAQTVRVQAGAITQAVHEHCKPLGLTWPVDFASKGSSHVGGNIATNAGGINVIARGMTRNWVLGLQVVTLGGEVLELNGALEKNNTGLDLRQLFIGTEGTLGVITEATLKLARIHESLDVFFFALKDLPTVFKLFQEARRAPFELTAFECLTQNCLDRVKQNLGSSSPFAEKSGAYVLLEAIRPRSEDAQNLMDSWLSDLFAKNLVSDGVLAQSPKEAEALWKLREGISESLSATGFVYKNDIALPIASLESFIGEMMKMYETHHSGFEVFLFGHIGDGNLHVNTRKPEALSKEEFLTQCKQADLKLFALVQKHGGSISAEHGIGLLKKEALRFTRTTVEMQYLKAIKKVFDPDGLLNPGKIFD
jgi:FAD/FMN-containing dehydrogenase